MAGGGDENDVGFILKGMRMVERATGVVKKVATSFTRVCTVVAGVNGEEEEGVKGGWIAIESSQCRPFITCSYEYVSPQFSSLSFCVFLSMNIAWPVSLPLSLSLNKITL